MAKRQTKNKRKRSVLAPSPPQMVILRVCMVLLALLLVLGLVPGAAAIGYHPVEPRQRYRNEHRIPPQI